MTTPNHNTQQGVVKTLRNIREQISKDIKDMSFEQERSYLDNILARKEKATAKNVSSPPGEDPTQHRPN